MDALRRELEAVKKRQHATEDDKARLQTALTRKNQECLELAQSRDAIRKQADQQVQELEEALGDVQKRMLDSECKVKQLQAHVVAVKEHLGGQAADELRAQLQEVKAKYEGASAEVGRVRNRLKQSEKALEEYKSSEGLLAAEAERLGQDLGALTAERDELADALLEAEAQLKEAQVKHGNVVPAEKFDNMKNLLSNAVDEKERQLAELREDYDRVLEEVAELHRELDNQSAQGGKGAVSAEDHQRIRVALEEQNASLKRRLADVTTKSQALIHEVEETEEEREMLREQLDELNTRIEVDFVPLNDHEECRRSMVKAMEELEDKLVEASERFGKAEAQVHHLQTERASLHENLSGLQSASDRRRGEADALASRNADLVEEMEVWRRKCADGAREIAQLTERSESLGQQLDGGYVPRQQHEQAKRELSAALEDARAQTAKLETKEKESDEALRNVKDGSDKLKAKLEKVLSEMESEYVSLKDHEAATVKLSAEVVEAESRAEGLSAMYALAQEETAKLNLELEAQKKELDTIQEAITSKFIPAAAIEEQQKSHNATVKDLEEKLLRMEEKYNEERSAGERYKEEAEKLKVEVGTTQKRLEKAVVTSEKSKEVEGQYKGKMEELTLKVVNLEQRCEEEAAQRAKAEEQSALSSTELRSLERRLESELARIEEYEAERRTLRDAVDQTRSDCDRAREAQREEAQRTCALQEELEGRRGDQSALLQQHTWEKGALEAEVAKLQLALQEEEESSGQRAEDVSALQSELLRATQALEELRDKEEQVGHLETEKQRLEEEVADLSRRLLGLADQCDGLRREAAKAQEGEDAAKMEMKTAQEKGHAIEREIRELKERYDESLGTIGDLQKRIQTSAELTEVKDKKVQTRVSNS